MKPVVEGSLAFSADPGLLRRGIDGPKPCPSCVIIGVPWTSAVGGWYYRWPGKPHRRDSLNVGGIQYFSRILEWKYCPSLSIIVSNYGGAVAVKKDGSSFATQRLFLPLSVKPESDNNSGGG